MTSFSELSKELFVLTTEFQELVSTGASSDILAYYISDIRQKTKEMEENFGAGVFRIYGDNEANPASRSMCFICESNTIQDVIESIKCISYRYVEVTMNGRLVKF